MAVLIEIRGDHQRELRLANVTTLGRAPSNTIQLTDPLVSRAHAEIRKTDAGDYEIDDLDSTHGTFLGTERITRRVLVDGDEVILGATRLRFFREFETLGARRWGERVKCELPVQITLANGDQIDCHASDISLGGMRLDLELELELDTIIELAVAFPNRLKRVIVKARVARERVDKGHLGVAFVFSSDRAHLALAEGFAKLLREAPTGQRSKTGA
ncbi:FHA domain-containing protein [Myxococcota bacterium]